MSVFCFMEVFYRLTNTNYCYYTLDRELEVKNLNNDVVRNAKNASRVGSDEYQGPSHKRNLNQTMPSAGQSKRKQKTGTNKANDQQSTGRKLSDAKYRYLNWWIGFAFSLLPICVIPLFKILNYEIVGIWAFFIELLKSGEILYLAVSLVIASLNDSVSSSQKDFSLWRGAMYLFLAAGVALYVVVTIAKDQSPDINTDFIVLINAVFIAIALIAGTYPYRLDIKDANGGN